MSTNTAVPNRQVQFSEAQGRLPEWVWRAISTADRAARRDRIPALIIDDNRRKLVVVDADDWNEMVAGLSGEGG
jgi:hypothetical protein